MAATPGLASYGRAYVSGVVLLGLAVIGTSVLQLYSAPVPLNQWVLLAALTLISGSATVKLASIPASISISETFVFTAVLLYGPAAGTLIVSLDGLVMSFWIARRLRVRDPYRALFNMSAPAVSVWCAAHLFFSISGIAPLNVQPASLDRILPALVVFAITYFGLNSWLITFAIAAHTRTSLYLVWRTNFLWISLNYFCGASVAILLVMYTRDIDVRNIAIIAPLLLVLYFTFKTSMGRVEDARTHVEQVDRLYLSTVETLAMAIDAKDQITHGHIRRVQTAAIGLARHLGVTEPKLIKAIEAAALLHDTGKLAVPEYILNKPGKLTAAEFEKMKLHANAGADILLAIDFPYPVVPIVRHHHEQWDGHGYPHGLKGADIPIGARILAVVDCFDALTSDRPYRPRLPDDEAVRILKGRRGSMYDPAIVDMFVAVHDKIAPGEIPSGVSAEDVNGIASSSHGPISPDDSSSPEDIAVSAHEASTMHALARALAGQVDVNGIGKMMAEHVSRLIPFTLCVVYLYESATDELNARFAIGESASIVNGLKMDLGEHLSGWVAANRQTIINSDPILDLGDIARLASSTLRSCLSTPLLADDELVGVLSLYASGPEAFSEQHQRILEAVSRQASDAFKHAVEFDGAAT